MRKALMIFGKSLLALLSLAGVALLWLTGWLVWHYEYGIGLPTESTLSALSSTDHVCAAGGRGAFVPLADIPPLVRKAVVAFEDPDFYASPSAGPLTQFALAAISNRRPTGSNISLSVTRYCLKALSPECCKGIDWHIGNWVFMGRVERALSRDRILEIYLNDTYFGRNANGVVMAAEAYFGKPLAELDVHEIAFMLVRARRPYRSQGYDGSTRDFVIDRMLKAEVISEAQAVAAKAHPLPANNNPTDGQNTPINQ